jgi:hypothetical protein
MDRVEQPEFNVRRALFDTGQGQGPMAANFHPDCVTDGCRRGVTAAPATGCEGTTVTIFFAGGVGCLVGAGETAGTPARHIARQNLALNGGWGVSECLRRSSGVRF